MASHLLNLVAHLISKLLTQLTHIEHLLMQGTVLSDDDMSLKKTDIFLDLMEFTKYEGIIENNWVNK